jgi:5-methylcytosine-specific restriction endonuclease McrA
MPVALRCAVCDKPFFVPPSQVKAGRKYCSTECASLAHTGSSHWRWTNGGVLRTCKNCGKEFNVKEKVINRGGGQYCSRKCASSMVKEKVRVIKKCKVCAKEIEVKLSHFDKEGTYCSRTCMAIDYRRRMRKDKNPNYKHGNSPYTPAAAVRRERIRRNGGRHNEKDIAYLLRHQRNECAHCGCRLDKYEVDHIIPILKGGSNYVGNLQLLCRKCNARKSGKFMVEWRYEHIIKERKRNERMQKRRDERAITRIRKTVFEWASDNDKKYMPLKWAFYPAKKNMPDVLLPYHVYDAGVDKLYTGLAIEFKAQRPQQQADARTRAMVVVARLADWRCVVCYGAQEGYRRELREYLGMED